MRKLNYYYVISTILLVLMMFILVSTLQVTGWFEDHGEKSPAEQLRYIVLGQYHFEDPDTLSNETHMVKVSSRTDIGKPECLTITLDTIPFVQVKVSDFEDEQVLIELFKLDSSGQSQRLEGCELLLEGGSSEIFTGGTVGDFCGLRLDSQVYIDLMLQLDKSSILIQLESKRIEDQASLEIKKYMLERIDSR